MNTTKTNTFVPNSTSSSSSSRFSPAQSICKLSSKSSKPKPSEDEEEWGVQGVDWDWNCDDCGRVMPVGLNECPCWKMEKTVEKPKTAYGHFLAERKPILQKKNPDMLKSLINKRLKTEWTDMSDRRKAKYLEMEAKGRKAYARRMAKLERETEEPEESEPESEPEEPEESEPEESEPEEPEETEPEDPEPDDPEETEPEETEPEDEPEELMRCHNCKKEIEIQSDCPHCGVRQNVISAGKYFIGGHRIALKESDYHRIVVANRRICPETKCQIATKIVGKISNNSILFWNRNSYSDNVIVSSERSKVVIPSEDGFVMVPLDMCKSDMWTDIASSKGAIIDLDEPTLIEQHGDDYITIGEWSVKPLIHRA